MSDNPWILTSAGALLGMLVGAACRFFKLPAPSPPRIEGALLVVVMTAGYVLALHLRDS